MVSLVRSLLARLRGTSPAGGERVSSAQPQLEQLEERNVPTLIASEILPLLPPMLPDGGIVLSAAEVGQLLDRASAATASNDAIIAIVDRGGRILGVRRESGVDPAFDTSNPDNLTFAVDGAVALARTGAFFANNQAPLTSRTIQFISQSTITEREVNSNPSIADPNSTLRGPGFVAPVGIGAHFPPNVMHTPQVDLFAIEHTNRDTTVKNGVTLPNRFNVPDAFIPDFIKDNGLELAPPDSYGFISGIAPTAQPRGIGTLPGGIPIYKNGVVVGGIGVFFPGQTGYATAENSILSTTYDPSKPDRSLEAEYMAFAAVDPTVGIVGGVAPVAGISIPLGGRIDLVGITLDLVGPNGQQGPAQLLAYGRSLGEGAPVGVNEIVNPGGDTLIDGTPVPEGWLVTPHAGTSLSAADVVRIVNQGIAQAVETRAAIRLPLNSSAKMVFAVTDPATGEVLGLYRMHDATVFSIDVAVAKARNVAYYADASQLQPEDQLPGVPAGVAFTNRTFRYLADPRYPEGVDGTPPGFFSILNDGGVNPTSGQTVGAPLPASAFQSVMGHDAFNPGTNFHQVANPLNQNGIVFFPGSAPLYQSWMLVGGFGVSGDGVDQDDVVTVAGQSGYEVPPNVLRADQIFFRDVRLPYQKFNRQPLLP